MFLWKPQIGKNVICRYRSPAFDNQEEKHSIISRHAHLNKSARKPAGRVSKEEHLWYFHKSNTMSDLGIKSH